MLSVMALYSELFRRSDIFFTKAFEEKLAFAENPKKTGEKNKFGAKKIQCLNITDSHVKLSFVPNGPYSQHFLFVTNVLNKLECLPHRDWTRARTLCYFG
jgi:hypothetical protein